MITVRSKDKVSPETVLLVFVLKLDLGMIYHFVHISDFLFYLKNRGTQRITFTHTPITFLKKSSPISPSASRASQSQLWANSSWLRVFVHVAHELKMIITCLSGQKKTGRRLLKVHDTWLFYECSKLDWDIAMHAHVFTAATVLRQVNSCSGDGCPRAQNMYHLGPSQKICWPLPYWITIANILVCFLLGSVLVWL